MVLPRRVMREIAENAKVLFVPEMNLKQIFYEVKRAVEGYLTVDFPIYLYKGVYS